MRGVSLPNEPVFSLLKSDFVVGWKNIIKEKYVGESHGYKPDQTSVGTTNGAGPHNVQMFVLSPDGIVLHALPGFWHPEDLASELRFAQLLWGLWKDPRYTVEEKRTLYSVLQLAELQHQPKFTSVRSGWQGFDAKNEVKRLEKGDRDTFVHGADGQVCKDAKGQPQIKTTNVVAHERLAARPFVPFEKFDVFEFADYGRTYYDNNKKVDGAGVTFMTPKKLAKMQRGGRKKAAEPTQAPAKKAEAKKAERKSEWI